MRRLSFPARSRLSSQDGSPADPAPDVAALDDGAASHAHLEPHHDGAGGGYAQPAHEPAYGGGRRMRAASEEGRVAPLPGPAGMHAHPVRPRSTSGAGRLIDSVLGHRTPRTSASGAAAASNPGHKRRGSTSGFGGLLDSILHRKASAPPPDAEAAHAAEVASAAAAADRRPDGGGGCARPDDASDDEDVRHGGAGAGAHVPSPPAQGLSRRRSGGSFLRRIIHPLGGGGDKDGRDKGDAECTGGGDVATARPPPPTDELPTSPRSQRPKSGLMGLLRRSGSSSSLNKVLPAAVADPQLQQPRQLEQQQQLEQQHHEHQHPQHHHHHEHQQQGSLAPRPPNAGEREGLSQARTQRPPSGSSLNASIRSGRAAPPEPHGSSLNASIRSGRAALPEPHGGSLNASIRSARSVAAWSEHPGEPSARGAAPSPSCALSHTHSLLPPHPHPPPAALAPENQYSPGFSYRNGQLDLSPGGGASGSATHAGGGVNGGGMRDGVATGGSMYNRGSVNGGAMYGGDVHSGAVHNNGGVNGGGMNSGCTINGDVGVEGRVIRRGVASWGVSNAPSAAVTAPSGGGLRRPQWGANSVLPGMA
uniref:Uncharacterized protein n=1 Tax=Chlamydomonas euryale TaxID=1486919 RepID=A0A7R9Z7A5_9CHLO